MSDEQKVSRAEMDRTVEKALEHVTLQIGLTEKVMGARIDGLKASVRWQIIAGLVGGQGLAALLATRTTPAEAVALMQSLFT